ncbi:MAG TPA: cytochrome c peroxidase [Acidobacteriaceae bacterium]|nr:cytochrome c peroxidase [Acidobacteriaceae bacterium]
MQISVKPLPSPRLALVAAILGTALIGCRSHSDQPIGEPIAIAAPLGLPPVPIPKDNPPTAASIALGRRLFYDTRLSLDNTVACASCHSPATAFADPRPVSIGVGGAPGVRNAPTVLDAAYLPVQFWDGRAASLEQQSASPMVNPVEMDQNHNALVFRLNADPNYRKLAQAAFGSPMLDMTRVEKALASFERTLLSGDSPFDRYQYGGDKSALTPAQVRGLAVFLDPNRGNCAVCHTIGPRSALFTDGKFHNLGVGVRDDGSFADTGRAQITGNPADTGAFRTPTLRNVALTAPYMHDGSERTLQQAVDFYAGKGNSNPYLDKEMLKIHLSGQDRADLVEFLKSLTGTMPPNAGPPPAPERTAP